MNSKNPSIRILGQRSLPSAFVFSSSNRSTDFKEDVQIKGPAKGSRLSLSDFLNRRLHQSSVLPISGKDRPFSSPVSSRDVSGSIGENGDKKRMEAEVNCVPDVAFEQLKHTRKEKEESISLCADLEAGSSSTTEMQESRKRRNPFEGGEKESARKLLVVLGDDPKPKQKAKNIFMCSEKPKPIFNHYANGKGWWDCNMEGIDNDEVGCHEVWEGIGSTTLGGLDWH